MIYYSFNKNKIQKIRKVSNKIKNLNHITNNYGLTVVNPISNAELLLLSLFFLMQV